MLKAVGFREGSGQCQPAYDSASGNFLNYALSDQLSKIFIA